MWSVIPAALAAPVALSYRLLTVALSRVIHKLGPAQIQTLVGTAAFAALATAWPVLRFSGHEDFGFLVDSAQSGAWGPLLIIALLQPVATALCLVSGWGGEIFPLLIIGAAMGALVSMAIPAIPLSVAISAGVGAACAVGLNRVVACVLIVVFLIDEVALGPVVVGAMVAAAALKLMPDGVLPAKAH